MSTTNDITRIVNDLAGHWTDPTLEILKAAGVQHVSVEMELEAWRALKGALQSEIRWQRAFRFSKLVSLSSLMEQVLRKAALAVARKFGPQAGFRDVENRIRHLVGGRRATAVERRLFVAMVHQPAMTAAFKAPTRTDYFPRLQGLAVGG